MTKSWSTVSRGRPNDLYDRPASRSPGVALCHPDRSLLLYLFVLWFALRDRYQIFLYYHDMGVGFDTSPFGAVTTGRYWMTGLVASGLVSLLYLAAALMGGYLLPYTRPPRWHRLWLSCAVPLVVAIPAIVMTVNEPTLPLSNSLQVTAATLVGLALALRIGELVIRRPLRGVVWLLADGSALAMLLIAFTSLQNFPRWLSSGNTGFISGVIAFTFVGLGILALTTVLRTWRRVPMPAAARSVDNRFGSHLPLAAFVSSLLLVQG